MDVSLAFWKAADGTFDRSGWALVEMTEKLPRDVAANTAETDSTQILERLFHAPWRGNCDTSVSSPAPSRRGTARNSRTGSFPTRDRHDCAGS
jgi:hypothetical protein